MDLAEQVEMEPMRLAQLNGLSALDSFEAQQWVALPDSIESSLFLVASLDADSAQDSKPDSFADDNLAAKMKRLGKLLASPPCPGSCSPDLGDRAGMSGGLSWPDLPDFGQLRRPQLWLSLAGRKALTSGYGWRWGRMHRGIDVANSVELPSSRQPTARLSSLDGAQAAMATWSSWPTPMAAKPAMPITALCWSRRAKTSVRALPLPAWEAPAGAQDLTCISRSSSPVLVP